MSAPLTTAVIEDHDALRDATVNMLRAAGFTVFGLPCAEDLDQLTEVPDLYVIDINLPGENGLALARRVRQHQPSAGIIITTARTHLNDRLLGYESGADVYLPKPVEPLELAAALKALGNRVRGAATPPAALCLEVHQRTLTGPVDTVRLAESEARLLAAFAIAPQQTLERWQVAAQLNPESSEISIDNLQNRISQLRKKIAASGVRGDTIRAVRSEGYRLCIDLQVR